MKTKETLTTADEVALQANIYFDYNFPVLTNEAVTSFRILGVDGFDVSHISVFPNPTNNIVNIQSLSTIKNIEVYDVQGRKIQAVEATQQNTQVDISALRTGVYFFSIKTEKGSTVKKIVKR